jgi:L-threonylcarbamoyladenylate synthase
MKLIPIAEATDRVAEIAETIANGGLACFPVRGSYRIAADASSLDAITRLMQSKRRARNHPALIIVGDLAAARTIVDGTAWKTTKRLAERLWPGPLTMVLPPSDDLSPKIKKILTRATGKLGVRITDDPLAAAIVRRFGRPMLLSSANLEQKPGASSAATVRQRFVNAVDVWVDAGDVTPTPPSTIVELTETSWKIIRQGSVTLSAIESASEGT